MSHRRRVLVVGVGSIGERHLRCFQATGRADVSFVEINDTLRTTIAERYGIAQPWSSLEAALENPPDAAVIATPAPYHIPQALQLAAAGVHLLIEKPLSTSLERVPALLQEVQRRNLVAAVAYVYRVHPLLVAVKQALDAGRFGRPVELVSVSGQHFPTYRPAYRQIYYTDRAKGGGAIQDALTHLINAGEWLVGPVSRVVVDAAHQVLDGVEVEDTVHLLARHGSVLGNYALNQHQAPNETNLTIVCERGTVRCEFHQNRWRWMTEPGNAWTDEQLPPLERDSIFILQAQRFLDAVERRAAPACSLEDGLQTLRVNIAALASWDEGRWKEVQ